MDDFADGVKRVWGDLTRGAKELGETTGDKLQKYRRIQQLNANIKKAKSRRLETLMLMGRKVYALHKKDKVANKDLLKRCEEIDELLKTIDQWQEEIERIRAEPTEEEVELEDESQLEAEEAAEDAPEQDEGEQTEEDS